MKIPETIKKFSAYLWGKKKELADMDEKDVLLGKVVMDIHRKRSHTTMESVPLFALFPIHPIDREGSLAATRERSQILTRHREELKEVRQLNRETLTRIIPSVSAIKAVKIGECRYVTFEGNGRLAALQEVFSEQDGMEVEVELYHFPDDAKIVRRVERVRRLHGLAGENK